MKSKKRYKLLAVFLITLLTFTFNVNIDFERLLQGQGGIHISIGEPVFAAFDPAVDYPIINAGGFHVAAIMNDSTLTAWGYDNYGQLGIMDTVNKSVPTAVDNFNNTTTKILNNVKQVSSGESHTLAVTNDGRVCVWGYNGNYQLGTGNTNVMQWSPIMLADLTGVKQVEAGDYASFALMNDGTVKAWGSNASGNSGLGDDPSMRNVPTTIPGLTGVKQIAAGHIFALFLMNDGTVKACGLNSNGQLGLGDTTNRTTPTAIPGLTGVKSIDAGMEHGVALLTNGTVKVWGRNNNSQLGLGDTTNRLTPTLIASTTLSGVTQITAGGYHTIALLSAGTIKIWGSNSASQLGLGDTTTRTVPTAVSGLTGIKQVSASRYSTFFLMNDGTVKDVGANNYGQLGIGTVTTKEATIATVAGLQFNAPKILVEKPIYDSYFSAADTAFIPTALVSDWDNSTLICRYYIDSVLKETKSGITNTSTPQTINFTAFNMTTLANGSHTMQYELVDGTKISQVTVNFKVDKLLPSITSQSITSTPNSIDIAINASDSGSGLDTNAYRYTVDTTTSAWGPSKTYSQTGLLPDKSYAVKIEVRDKVGNITQSTQTAYTAAQTPAIAISNPTKTTLDISLDPLITNPATTQYQIACGSSYIITNGTLSATPTWITLTNRKITATGLNSSTNYTFTAKAKNGGGIETVAGASKTGLTIAASPTNIAAVSSKNAIALNWDVVSNATSYDVMCDGVTTINVNTNSYTHNGLAVNTLHKYKVKANNASGAGDWSAEFSKYTLADPPANITASVTRNSVILSWSSVLNATGYDIYKDGTVISGVTGTSYTDSGLNPSTEHLYKVSTRNSGGVGTWSNEIVKLTLPDPPVNIRITPERNKLTLMWDAVAFATGYEIEADGVSVGTVPTVGYIHKNLSAETTHKYRIRTINSSGIGNWSDLVTKDTFPDAPITPLITNSSATQTIITITWEAVAGATSYEVKADGAVIDNGISTSFLHSNLSPKTSHSYAIRAKNIGGTSEWSNTISKDTLPEVSGIPGNVTAASTNTEITITWNSVQYADSYDIMIAGAIVDTVSSTHYVHRELEPDMAYTYAVRSKNEVGVSEWSSEQVIKTKIAAPSAPSNIIGSASVNEITINWDRVPYTESYDVKIYRVVRAASSNKSSNEELNIVTDDKTVIEDVNIEDGSNKELSTIVDDEIVSEDVNLEEENSDEELVTAIDNIAVTDNLSSIELTELQLIIEDNVTDNQYVCSNLEPDTEYVFNIRAKNEMGESNWSNDQTVKTGVNAPVAPQNITVTSTDDSLIISWGVIPYADSYEIEFDNEMHENINDTEYVFDNLIPGSEHVFKVRAQNRVGFSSWSDEKTAKVKFLVPQVPQNINAEVTCSQIRMSWDTVQYAESYEIEINGQSTENTTSCNYVYEGLEPNASVEFRIRAINEEGTSEWSEVKTFATANLPNAPEGINAKATKESITITWNAVQGAVSYDIEVDGIVAGNVIAATYTSAGLIPNTKHTYRVRIIDSKGTGLWSEPLEVNTFLLDIPGAITTDITSTVLSLNWSDIVGASGYEIKMNDNLINNISASEFVIEGLSPNTAYNFSIRAMNIEGSSDWSIAQSISTKLVIEDIPQNVVVTPTATSITLTWNVVKGATGYEVEQDGSIIDVGLNTTYTHVGLTPYTAHSYRIRAKNTYGMSDWSSKTDVMTKLSEPPTPLGLAGVVTPTTIKLNWQPALNATGYEIEVDGIIIDTGINMSYTHTGLISNSEHKYRVRAKNVVGPSPWSELLTVKATSPILKETCEIDKEFNIILEAKDITNFNNRIFSISYNKDELDAIDLCSMTYEKETARGVISGTSIEIIDFTPGAIKLKVNNVVDSGKSWSGIVNAIRFKSKINGQPTITYGIQ